MALSAGNCDVWIGVTGSMNFLHKRQKSLYDETVPDPAGEAPAIARGTDSAPEVRFLENPEGMLSFIDDARMGVAFVDSSMRYMYINSLLARAHDRSIEEHIGRSPREIAFDQWPVLESILTCVLAGETVLNEVYQAPTFPATFWCE